MYQGYGVVPGIPPRSLAGKLAALAFAAPLLSAGCNAPEPHPTGAENDEFDVDASAPAPDTGHQAPVGYSVMDCGEAMLGGVSVAIGFDDHDQLRIAWHGANALGVLVTDKDAILPAGPGEPVQGTAFWVLSTLEFPAGFSGPVTYGAVPEGSEDVTDKHGGTLGGSTLAAGVCYKFSVTNNEFATGSLVRGWK